MKSVYVIIAHEAVGFLRLQIQKLKELDPDSDVMVVSSTEIIKGVGGGIIEVPSNSARWGQLHKPLFEAMARSLSSGYDFMTVVDSDQLPIKPQWSKELAEMPEFGWAGTRARIFGGDISLGVVEEARRVIRKDWHLNQIMNHYRWDGTGMIWGFNPGSVYSREGMRSILQTDCVHKLSDKISATKLFAPEETIIPTLIGLSGLATLAAPGSSECNVYKRDLTIETFAPSEEEYWVHPIPRSLHHPLARKILSFVPNDNWEAIDVKEGRFSYGSFQALRALDVDGETLDESSILCPRAERAVSMLRGKESSVCLISTGTWEQLVELTGADDIIVTDFEDTPEKMDFVALCASSGNWSVSYHGTCARLMQSDDPIVEERHVFKR